MKKLHFFKAKSQLGCTGILYHLGKSNPGVERAPDAILDEDFLNILGSPPVSPFIFPHPDEIGKDELVEILVTNFKAFKEYINEKLAPGEIPLVVGGDHSIAFSSIMAALERAKKADDFGYIQIDSHGDMNLFTDSPSKNFHGMYLRPLLDDFDIPEIKNLVDKKINPGNVLFIGNLDLDPKERQFFQKQKIKNITGGQLQKDTNHILYQIQEFTSGFKYLHVSLDMDVFDKSIIPATGIPAQNGLFPQEVLPILKIVSDHPRLSFDISEINPAKAGAEESIKTAQEILLIMAEGIRGQGPYPNLPGQNR